MTFSIELPNRTGVGDPENIDSSGHIALIGANGSGKTRLMVLFASGAAQQIAIQP